jgi:ATP-binding cassette, subfamily A (ABC1), member 3
MLMFALAVVTLAFTLSGSPDLVSIEVLSAIFPPITYVTLVGDVVRAEIRFTSFSLSASDLPTVNQDDYDTPYPQFAGYFYIVFFMLQIFLYTAATFGVEKWLWGVKRAIKVIDAKSDIAMRCTELSKTFTSGSGSRVLAVDRLDLELKKGSVTFLLGPNGGGKTTTLKCIAGMTVMDPTSSLEINEDGLALGVCPQGNVSCTLYAKLYSLLTLLFRSSGPT